MPMNSAVREILLEKRLSCAIRYSRSNTSRASRRGRLISFSPRTPAGVAGVTGALVASSYSFSPTAGDAYTTKAFVVCVLGGLGSIPGAIAGGILLGVAENLASLFLDSGYRDAVGLGLLILVLLVRPRGLLGKRFFAEVKA